MACYHSAALEAGFKESNRASFLLSLLGAKLHRAHFKFYTCMQGVSRTQVYQESRL